MKYVAVIIALKIGVLTTSCDNIKDPEHLPKDKNPDISILISKADSLFNLEEYAAAREVYLDAKDIKPNNFHVNEQLLDVDLKLCLQSYEESLSSEEDFYQMYERILCRADVFFHYKEYEDARKFYQRAATIMPSEKYPFEKIAEIDAILIDKTKQDSNKR